MSVFGGRVGGKSRRAFRWKISGAAPHLRSLAAVSLILLMVTGLIFGASLLRQAGARYRGESAPVSAALSDALRPRVVVDPGHGGFDGGAIGTGGVVEKDLNLQLSLPLRDFLLVMGYAPVLTRSEDVSLDGGSGSIRERKREDLAARLALMEEDSAAPVLMIHQNQFTESQYSGAQMFYGTKNPASKELAERLRAGIVASLQPENTRELKKGNGDVWLLEQCSAPVVLVECGFISNPAECARLSNAEYRQQFAFTLAASLGFGAKAEE